jgi:hypothetical protein
MSIVERHTFHDHGLLPMRETFRALRYRFRQNGRLLRRVTKNIGNKVPFPDTAGKVFEGFESVVKDADKFASNVGRKVLKGSTPNILVKTSSLQTSDNQRLAQVAYSALTSIANYLGLKDAYVSESAALKALAKVNDRFALRQSETAAALLISLLDEKVVSYPYKASNLATAKILGEAIPGFALLLWLQSDCDDPYCGEAFTAASDLAVALSDDVERLTAKRDEGELARLFEEFSSHV